MNDRERMMLNLTALKRTRGSPSCARLRLQEGRAKLAARRKPAWLDPKPVLWSGRWRIHPVIPQRFLAGKDLRRSHGRRYALFEAFS